MDQPNNQYMESFFRIYTFYGAIALRSKILESEDAIPGQTFASIYTRVFSSNFTNKFEKQTILDFYDVTMTMESTCE